MTVLTVFEAQSAERPSTVSVASCPARPVLMATAVFVVVSVKAPKVEAGVVVLSVLPVVSMDAEPESPVAPVITRLEPLTWAERPDPEKPASALRAAAAAESDKEVVPRLTVCQRFPPPIA